MTDQNRRSPVPSPSMEALRCYDCQRPYSKGPDLVVSDADWAKISPRPDGGGVLCPNCMNDRFEAAGLHGIQAKFTSGPFASPSIAPLPDGREVEKLKHDIERHLKITTELATENARLSTRLREAEEALEPFARESDNWAVSVPNDYRSLCFEPGAKNAHPGSETAFTVGDLRRARALSGLGAEGKEKMR
jgi:hypothetical protein